MPLPTRGRFMQGLGRRFLTDRATVYVDDPRTGRFTNSITANLPNGFLACKMSVVSADAAPSAALRAELLAARQLFYEVTFTMPNTAEVAWVNPVSGLTERWNVVANTQRVETNNNIPIYQVCDVRRIPGPP